MQQFGFKIHLCVQKANRVDPDLTVGVVWFCTDCADLSFRYFEPLRYALNGGWRDFTFFSTVFKSYQDNGRVIMKGCVPWNPVCDRKDFRSQVDSNSGPLDNKASALPTVTGAPRFLSY